jgi:hypothetical protein
MCTVHSCQLICQGEHYFCSYIWCRLYDRKNCVDCLHTQQILFDLTMVKVTPGHAMSEVWGLAAGKPLL